MSTQLIEDIKKKNISNSKHIESFKFYIDLIRSYQSDNINTIKKIVSSYDNNPELAEEFKDIAKGIEGEFTRATALEMGKQKLISRLEHAVDDMVTNYVSIQTLINKPKEDLHNIFTSVYTNINIESLLDRKTRYNRTNLEKDFMAKKLSTVINTAITKLKISLTSKQYLIDAREILALIRTFEFNTIQKAINIYHNKCAHVANNFKYIGKEGEFHKDQNKIEYQLIEQNGDQKLNQLISLVHKEQEPEISDLELFDGLLDDLTLTRDRLKEIVENLGDVLNTIQVSEFNVEKTYGPGIKDFIKLYSKTELTNNEFLFKLNDSVITLYNTATVETDILNVIANALTNLNNYIYIFAQIYAVCEEATIKGTIIDGRTNVSLSRR